MAVIDRQQLLDKLANGYSLKAVKIGDVDFTGHVFETRVDFSGAIFTGKTVFKNAKFLDGVNFRKVEFSGPDGVDFGEATFSGEGWANFGGAGFLEGRADFRSAIFSGRGGANFRWARFSGKGGADFFKARFSGAGGADFGEAVFSGGGGAVFNQVECSGPGEIIFVATRFDKNCLISFRSIKVENPRNVRFENVYLGRTSFYKTNVEEFTFRNVRFHEGEPGLLKREQLVDEIWNDLAPEKKQRTYDKNYYRHLEILYRQLKRNFEGRHDSARAEDFHYGELEMRRRQKSPLRQCVSLAGLTISALWRRWWR
ncbi:MAG: pentapeptide repeat-containing protein [Nitrospinales bacterium]